jgi:hypothetical protein
MKKTLLALLLCGSCTVFAQNLKLELTNKNSGRISVIESGDKVLMAIKQARHDIKQKPSGIYHLAKNELIDSVFVITKGKIKIITDSSIFIKEKNSLFSATLREVNLEKINTLRRLSFGNQVFRTTTTVAGSLAAGIAIFYSYVAVGGGDGFVEGMFLAAGTGAVVTRFGRTKITKKLLGNQEIRLAYVNR